MNYKGKIAEAIVGVDIAGLPRFCKRQDASADAPGTIDDNTSSTN